MLAITGSADSQIISTFAGGGTSGPGDNGAATDCELLHPIGLAQDASGNIFIGDRDFNRIRKISPTGIITTIAGTGTAGFSGDNGPATAAKIFNPYGVIVDNTGNVYFSDAGNQRIRKIGVDGIISTIAGNGSTGFAGDEGPATAASLNGPCDLALDAAGNLFFADAENGRIRKISASGKISTVAGGGSGTAENVAATSVQLNGPYSLAFDNSGNLYVGEHAKTRVRKITVGGTISTVAGTGVSGYNGNFQQATNTKLDGALGLAVDWMGNLYISDAYNHRIRKVDPAGFVSTIAGNGDGGFSGDGGHATYAQLYTPADLLISTTGDLLIADFSNSRIRKILKVVSVGNISSESSSVDIFPNPNNGSFTVDPGDITDGSLRLYNLAGQLILERRHCGPGPIPVSINLPAGTYVLSLNSAEQAIRRTVTVIR